MKDVKRKYHKRLNNQLMVNRDFLITKLQREWENLERTVKREELFRKAKVGGKIMAKTLLTLLLIGGVCTMAVVAPNIFTIFSRTRRFHSPHAFFGQKEFRKIITVLKRRRYTRVNQRQDGTYEVSLTEFGAERTIKHAFGELRIERPKKWDGIWRVIIFDIPNRHKWARDALRDKLKQMGFYRLQESVFVFPFPCEEEISFLTTIYNIPDQHLKVIRTREITNDIELRRHFNV